MRKWLIITILLLLINPAYSAEIINGAATKIICPLTKISDGLPLTTGTINLTVQRASDAYYWTGSAWQSGSSSLAMTHENNGMWRYTTTLDTSGDMWLSCQDSGNLSYRISWTQTVFAANRFNDTADYVRIVDGTGTGEINTASGNVPITQSFPTNFSSQSIDTSGKVLLQPTQTGVTIPTVTTVTNDVGITQAGADKAWSTAARILTAGTNITLAKGTGVTGFNDLSAADVNTEVDTALNTAIPVSPTADSVNERIKAIDDKLPTNYIMGSAVITDKDDEIDAINNFVDTEITDIQNRLPAALVSGRMSSDMVALSGDTVAADALESAYDGTGYCEGCIAVTVSSGAATPASPAVLSVTSIITVDNQFVGWLLRCNNQERIIAATDENTADTIIVEPGHPFNPALGVSASCYIK